MSGLRIFGLIWTPVSTMFTVGAGVEDPHSFGFALYCGVTAFGLLCFFWNEAP